MNGWMGVHVDLRGCLARGLLAMAEDTEAHRHAGKAHIFPM